MSHDLEDLLNLIKELEERILYLEQNLPGKSLNLPDTYYWEHG